LWLSARFRLVFMVIVLAIMKFSIRFFDLGDGWKVQIIPRRWECPDCVLFIGSFTKEHCTIGLSAFITPI
jgi:hypothetical protein